MKLYKVGSLIIVAIGEKDQLYAGILDGISAIVNFYWEFSGY